MKTLLGLKLRCAGHSWGRFLSVVLVFVVSVSAAAEHSELPNPPDEAACGQKVDGIQIGLWTEKSVYRGNEVRNVWMFARTDRSSPTTIGVGGNLFEHSFLYISSKNVVVATLPLDGGIDGILNPTSMAGGISGMLADLPRGTYQLVWKTDMFESNTIAIEIEND